MQKQEKLSVTTSQADQASANKMSPFEKEARAALGLQVPEEDQSTSEQEEPEGEFPLTRQAEATLQIAKDAAKKHADKEQALAGMRKSLGIPPKTSSSL